MELKMSKFFKSLNSEMKEYLSILEPEFPEWLEEYINVPELARIDKVSMFCGKDYSALAGVCYPISNLVHSVGVALIVWHFTHDKAQTLAGLFHDIATPAFKHCIDYMNGDAETQESTEERTESIISGSKQIMTLLARDGISINQVSDYKIYPIADNPTPGLSADRFEYNFTCGLSLSRVFDINDVREIYSHTIVGKNEKGEIELAFDDLSIAEKYIIRLRKLWPIWCDEKNNVYMQFLADICGSMSKIGKLSVSDLYSLGDEGVIEKIKNCGDSYLSNCMNKFLTHTKIEVLSEPQPNRYCVKLKSKRRYVSPLVKTEKGFVRAKDISPKVNDLIENYLNEKFDKYGCLDFDFVPYK